VEPDHHPYTTGGVGVLGSVPSQEALQDHTLIMAMSWEPPFNIKGPAVIGASWIPASLRSPAKIKMDRPALRQSAGQAI